MGNLLRQHLRYFFPLPQGHRLFFEGAFLGMWSTDTALGAGITSLPYALLCLRLHLGLIPSFT